MKITFTHNVYNRFNTLNNTIKIEKLLFPTSNSIVAYNFENPLTYLDFENIDNIKFINFNGLSHKIGCTNGCIVGMQEAIKTNCDVIIFSHDDVSIVPTVESLNTVNKNIELIISGKYDAICRKPLPTTSFGNNYYLMEVFYISKNAAEKVFSDLKIYNNESQIPKDIRGSISPEVFLYMVMKNKNLNVLEMEYIHETKNYNKILLELMGFTHKNAGERGWND